MAVILARYKTLRGVSAESFCYQPVQTRHLGYMQSGLLRMTSPRYVLLLTYNRVPQTWATEGFL